jgi:hypothetical protein
MSWVVYLNFLCPGKYLCWLNSQLSFISLLSFEMLFDCVINGLYMRVLKLTWEKLNSTNFSSIFYFSVWSVRTVLFTSKRARHQRPDGKVTHPKARDLSVYFRGSACPDSVNDSSGQGHHRLYIYLGRRTFTLPLQEVFFWPLVSDFLQVFGIILPFLVFLCINLTFQLFF